MEMNQITNTATMAMTTIRLFEIFFMGRNIFAKIQKKIETLENGRG